MQTDQKNDLFDLNALSKESLGKMPDPFFQEEPEVEGQKYLLFQLGDDFYGVISDRVSEVVRMLPITEIPNVPDWFLGIANLRGDILSVVELSILWNQKRPPANPKEKLIVLRSQTAETNLAIRADRVKEIVSIPEGTLEHPDVNLEHVFAGADHKSARIRLINPTSLLTNLTLR